MSRTDHDYRKWASVGRLNTSDWEERIRANKAAYHDLRGPKTIQLQKWLPYNQEMTPEVKIQRSVAKGQGQTKGQKQSELRQSCSKEEIIKQWVRQSSQERGQSARSAVVQNGHEEARGQGQEEEDVELRRLAYNIAETVVDNIERDVKNESSNLGAQVFSRFHEQHFSVQFHENP